MTFQTLPNSPDSKPRQASVDMVGIIIHHTGVGGRKASELTPSMWSKLAEGAKHWLMLKDKTYASAHYLIAYDGKITQLVDPKTHIAFHAGESAYFHPTKRAQLSSWNQYSIGIELVGDGNVAPFSEAQYESLVKLCRILLRQFPSIDPRCITGHENIAPGRKSDPGKFFNWKTLFAGIFAAGGNHDGY